MKIKNLLLTALLITMMAGNVSAQTKSDPIVQDFESGMNEWTFWCEGDSDEYSYGSVDLLGMNINNTPNGQYSFNIDANGDYDCYLISPELSYGGGVDMSFYYTNFFDAVAFEVPPTSFQLGFSTTTSDLDAFSWGDIIIANNGQVLEIIEEEEKYEFVGDAGWLTYSTGFPVGVKYIAIAVRSGGFYLFVDDINISEASGCPKPYNLNVTSTEKTSLSLSWEGTNSSYELQYKSGFPTTFEYGFEGWTSIDADEDGYNWTLSAAGSNRYVYSESYHDEGGTNPEDLTPDNYLVSPLIPLGGSITFWAKGMDEGAYQEHFGVAISTTGNQDPDDFVTIDEWTAMSSDWRKYTVDLSQYSGMGYVAIRHFMGEDESQWALCIDDITLFTSPEWTTVTEIENTSVTLEDLMFETNYVIQLRGICDENEPSSWTNELFAMTSNADCRFINAGDWNEAANWRNNVVPGANSDVVIAAAATIPADCLAQSNNINLSMGSITIQDGGQLKHNNAGVVATMEKSIIGYSGDHDNYKLVAMPMTVSEHNLISDSEYDLYMFDQTGGIDEQPLNLEWRNYKAGQFDFVSGLGYLYANDDDMTISITGELESISEEGYPVSLVLDEDVTTQFPGWNLIGNPYACNAYLSDNRDFYRLVETDEGSKLQLASEENGGKVVAPMEGIFVTATENDEEVIFTDSEPQANSVGMLDFTLRKACMRLNMSLDRASVRFGEGRNLGHLDFMADGNRIYVPLDGKAMSVVYSQSVGEMPLNFDAATDGTFILGFTNKAENMVYCHLIDNLTGADIDLLQEPNYTFEARTTDYASRFRVVFASNEVDASSDAETFAFNSNGTWIVVNDGQATLQVVDMMGRLLSSETIDGSAAISVNQPAGIYMFRLINGNDVKVQKVVVR